MEYLNTDGNDIAWDFIRSAYNTVARTSIMLIQVGVLSMAAKRIHAWEEPNQWQQQEYARDVPVNHVTECVFGPYTSLHCVAGVHSDAGGLVRMSVILQDIMRLDNSGRMNLPGSVKNNWTWRIGDSDVWKKLAPEAKALKKLGCNL